MRILIFLHIGKVYNYTKSVLEYEKETENSKKSV